MRQWLIACVLVACGGKQSRTAQPAATGPTCAEVGVHAAPMFHTDDATSDRIAASVAGHCDVDGWSVAAKTCAMAASNHDALHDCSYQHLTREQSDKLTASLTPMIESVPARAQTPAAGETQAEIAERSATEGQALFAQGKYAEASSRYMDAVARVPEPRYFYLLGQSKYREGKLAEALTAVDAAEKNNSNAALTVKIRELRTMITSEAKSQGIKL